MSNKSSCRGCGEPIVWMETQRGKRIPVDADSVEEDMLGLPQIFDPDTMTAHFASCPYADQFRQSK